MSDKVVKNICLFCDGIIKPNSEAVYCVNIKLVNQNSDSWRFKNNGELKIIFKNSKNPKNAVHRECWDNFFETDVKENVKKKNKKAENNRLDSIE